LECQVWPTFLGYYTQHRIFITTFPTLTQGGSSRLAERQLVARSPPPTQNVPAVRIAPAVQQGPGLRIILTSQRNT